MEEQKWNKLVDHLDEMLQSRSGREPAQWIQEDTEARSAWQYLQLATEAIEYDGLYHQVTAVREQYRATQQAAQRRTVPLFRKVLRVAAAVIILAGAIGAYQYFSTSAAGFYQDHYASFELPVDRGTPEAGPLEQAYRNKEWAAVITLAPQGNDTDNKTLFLTGMAHLELKQFNEAVVKFENILANNKRTGDPYFQDEAEYYLALGLMADHQSEKARSLFKKIKADPQHLFHEKVEGISGLEWKILEFKGE